MDSLRCIPVSGGPEGFSNLLFFPPLHQHHVFWHAEPKPWHIDSCTSRPSLQHLLNNHFFSFKTAKTDDLIFKKMNICFNNKVTGTSYAPSLAKGTLDSAGLITEGTIICSSVAGLPIFRGYLHRLLDF